MDEKPLTVLVVDDDESVRRAMQRLLRSNGYQVFTFDSAEDLLHSNLVCDRVCLLLAIRLPGISGLDLYAKLVSKLDRIEVYHRGGSHGLAKRFNAHLNSQLQGEAPYEKRPQS